MLEMRPNCQCCDADLPPESARARICSLECTYCADCAESKLGGLCPGCGGPLASRPPRLPTTCANYPPSTLRVFAPEACA